jgi:Spy/CpxP family protein refolding chaperone
MLARTNIIAILMAVLMASSSALAQDRAEGPGDRGGQRQKAIIGKLGLGEQAASALMAELGAIRRERMGLMRTGRQYMEEVSRELEYSAPSGEKLKALLEKIEANVEMRHALRLREAEVLKKHLSVEQQARYMVLRTEGRRQMKGRSRLLKGYGDSGSGEPGMRQGPQGDGQSTPYGRQMPPR